MSLISARLISKIDPKIHLRDLVGLILIVMRSGEWTVVEGPFEDKYIVLANISSFDHSVKTLSKLEILDIEKNLGLFKNVHASLKLYI